MNKTPFAGITRLDPGESLAEDNFAFQDVDRQIIDKLLRVGAQSHVHDAHAALAHADPELAPDVAVLASGGTIASDLSITVGYTLVDSDGGETTLNATPVLLSTPAGLAAPDTAPTLQGAYASGTLLAGNYAYSVTVTDGVGGETTLGPASEVTLDPGYASGRVSVSGLTAIAAEGGGPGWRLWRAVNGGPLALIAVGTSDTVIDDGSLCPDTSVTPPTTTGSTLATSKLRVTVPAGQPSGAVAYNIYATLDGSFQSPALLGSYPIASAGVQQEYTAFAPLRGAPPIVSRALAGANLIALPAPETRTAVTSSAATGGFGSAWQNEGSVAPPVSFWLDENGDLQLEGAAMKVTAPADGDVIFTLPPTHRAPAAPYAVVGGDGTTPRAFAAVDLVANGDVVWRAGPASAGAWIAFSGLRARL